MNKNTITKEDATIKTSIKTMIKSFADLQAALHLVPDDADAMQMVAALKHIELRVDEPSFPTAEDFRILMPAISIARKYDNAEIFNSKL